MWQSGTTAQPEVATSEHGANQNAGRGYAMHLHLYVASCQWWIGQCTLHAVVMQ